MSQEMTILSEGRTLIKTEVVEMTPTKIITVCEYDDGTIIKFYQEADNITVDCNKTLEIQPDGKTVRIIG
jgi:hypothetical protein